MSSESRVPASTRQKRRGRAESENSPSELVKALTGAGFGILSGCIVGAILLLIGAGIVYAQADPDPFVRPVGIIALALSSLLAGWFAEKKSHASAPLVGLFTGFGFTLLCWLLTIFANPVLSTDTSVFLLTVGRGIQLLITVGGAYLGKRRPKPVKRRRR